MYQKIEFRIGFFMFIMLAGVNSFAQQTINLTVQDAITHQAIIGAVAQVKALSIGAVTDVDGKAKLNLGSGSHLILITMLGYEDKSLDITIPIANTEILIELKPQDSETDEVVITSTRTNSRIDDLPIKVEVLGIDDMNEENGIKPGNVASILGDLSVIHIQQTSSVTAGSVVRMQGLGGRYTQLLRDGLPVYDGFSGNLSIMQLPPLDLKQVEIVKGSASTLYGGGAISGMINLISKTPTDSTEASITLNQSTLQETNINSFVSKKIGKMGITLFAGHTLQKAQDINSDGFSDVPYFQNTLIHPRLFFSLSKKTDLNIGYSYFTENRNGGDMKALENVTDSAHVYAEKNTTNRQTVEARMEHRVSDKFSINMKSSWSNLKRLYERPGALLDATQITGYNEVSVLKTWENQSFVSGVNWISQQFHKNNQSENFSINSYTYNTVGAFAQLTRNFSKKTTAEVGARLDHHVQFGNFFLPRVSILYKPTTKLSIRLGSGMGYKVPDPFEYASISDLRYYQSSFSQASAEKSLGINNDIAYHTLIAGKLSLQVDQAFYYTRINPIVTVRTGSDATTITNNSGNIQALGTDSYVRLKLHPFELYLGYNHTQSTQLDSAGQKTKLAYAPNDKFATTLAYEPGRGWRVGVEASWVANQVDALQQARPNYWFLAAMIGKEFKHVRVVLNAENLLDYRQSRVESLYAGTTINPTFKSLWGPIEGRVINISVRFSL